MLLYLAQGFDKGMKEAVSFMFLVQQKVHLLYQTFFGLATMLVLKN